MRHAAILLTGLLLTGCQTPSTDLATIGPMDCRTGAEPVCVTNGGAPDRDAGYLRFVPQDVQAILDGMRRAQ